MWCEVRAGPGKEKENENEKGNIRRTNNPVSLNDSTGPEGGSTLLNHHPQLPVSHLFYLVCLPGGNNGAVVIIKLEQVLGVVQPGALKPLGNITRGELLIHHLLIRGGGDNASVRPHLAPEGGNVVHRPLPQLLIILFQEKKKIIISPSIKKV